MLVGRVLRPRVTAIDRGRSRCVAHMWHERDTPAMLRELKVVGQTHRAVPDSFCDDYLAERRVPAGKTTLAEQLHRRLPAAVVYNPEDVGLMLWKWMPPNDDFQDLPSWRELVVATALSLRRHHTSTLIVPMSLISDAYRDEILGALTKPARRSSTSSWRRTHVCSASASMPARSPPRIRGRISRPASGP